MSKSITGASAPAQTAVPTSRKFVEAQDTLCEVTFVGEFLYGSISNRADGFELDGAETLGLLNVIRHMVEKIEKACTLLDECKEDVHHG